MNLRWRVGAWLVMLGARVMGGPIGAKKVAPPLVNDAPCPNVPESVFIRCVLAPLYSRLIDDAVNAGLLPEHPRGEVTWRRPLRHPWLDPTKDGEQ